MNDQWSRAGPGRLLASRKQEVGRKQGSLGALFRQWLGQPPRIIAATKHKLLEAGTIWPCYLAAYGNLERKIKNRKITREVRDQRSILFLFIRMRSIDIAVPRTGKFKYNQFTLRLVHNKNIRSQCSNQNMRRNESAVRGLETGQIWEKLLTSDKMRMNNINYGRQNRVMTPG